jgi:hypothetical protein
LSYGTALKSSLYPLCIRLCGPQSRSAPREEEKIVLSLSEIGHRSVTDNCEFYVVEGDMTKTRRNNKKMKELPKKIHIEIIKKK